MKPALYAFLSFAAAWLWLSPPSPPAPSTPLPPQIHELVYGPSHQAQSVLWLLALGVPRLHIADGGKYASQFELESEDPTGARLYQVPVRNPAPAVLVSRYQWSRLPRITSLYDRQALAAYVQWANRPEAAGFRFNGRRGEVRADLGPDDMILVRRYARGWSASVPHHRDPIGFLLLDPPAAGPVTITLTAPVFSAVPETLPAHQIPQIPPGGIVYFSNRIITIYGHDLGGAGRTRVLAAGRDAEILWAGEHQVNARLPRGLPPGPAPLVVEHAGGRSHPVVIEIKPL